MTRIFVRTVRMIVTGRVASALFGIMNALRNDRLQIFGGKLRAVVLAV